MINDKATIDLPDQHAGSGTSWWRSRSRATATSRPKRSASACSCRPPLLQFPHGRYSENLVRRDEDSIRNLYQSNGFRDVKVTPRDPGRLPRQDGRYRGVIQIEEGPQYFISDLKVEGIEHLDKEEVLARLSSVAGQPFSEFNVAVDRDTILAQYFENGFPNATFEWSSKPAARAATASTSVRRSAKASSSSCARC